MWGGGNYIESLGTDVSMVRLIVVLIIEMYTRLCVDLQNAV